MAWGSRNGSGRSFGAGYVEPVAAPTPVPAVPEGGYDTYAGPLPAVSDGGGNDGGGVTGAEPVLVEQTLSDAYNPETSKYEFQVDLSGITRNGEPVQRTVSFSTPEQAREYLADKAPTQQSALLEELQAGVDIGRTESGNYLTASFSSADDFMENAQSILDRYAEVAGSADYVLGDQDTFARYSSIPGFDDLEQDPLLGRIGVAAYDRSEITDLLGQYTTIDSSVLGDDKISTALRGAGIDLGGGQIAVKTSTADYYKSLSDSINDSRIGYYGVNNIANGADVSVSGLNTSYFNNPVFNVTLDGQQYMYVPYEAGARTVGRKTTADPNDLAYLTAFTGNQSLFDTGSVVSLSGANLEKVTTALSNLKSGGDYSVFENPGLGYLLTPDQFKNVWSKAAAYGAPYTITAENGSFLNTGSNRTSVGWFGSMLKGRGTHSFGDLVGSWLQRDFDPATGQSLNLLSGLDALPSGVGNSASANALQASLWFSQGNTDKQLFSYQNQDGSWSQFAYDQWVEQRGGGGLFGGLLSFVAPVITLINPTFGLAFSAGFGLSQGLINGNLLQAVSGAMGLSSALGGVSFGSLLGDALSEVPGLEFLGNDFTGPLTQVQSAVAGAINQGVNGGIISGSLTGDPTNGIIGGSITGAVQGADLVNSIGDAIGEAFGVTDVVVQNAINAGISSGIRSGTITAVNGGSLSDVLENAAISGISSAAGNYVTNTVRGELNGVPSEQNPAPVETVTPTVVNDANYGELGSGTSQGDGLDFMLGGSDANLTDATNFGAGGYDISGQVADSNPFAQPTVDFNIDPNQTTDVLIDPNSGVDTSGVNTQDTTQQYFGGSEVTGEYNDGIYFNSDLTNVISGAAGGAIGGGINAGLHGGDIGTGIISGALGGAAGGLASDLGTSPVTAGVVGNTIGAIVNNELQPDPQNQTPPAVGQAYRFGLGFSDLGIPNFVDLNASRANMNWGSRLSRRQ